MHLYSVSYLVSSWEDCIHMRSAEESCLLRTGFYDQIFIFFNLVRGVKLIIPGRIGYCNHLILLFTMECVPA